MDEIIKALLDKGFTPEKLSDAAAALEERMSLAHSYEASKDYDIFCSYHDYMAEDGIDALREMSYLMEDYMEEKKDEEI